LACKSVAPAGDQRGAVMVEMAIVLPIFLAIVFAIFEFSLVVFEWSLAGESTRVGARYAIVSSPVCAGVSAMACPGGAISCSPAAGSQLLIDMQQFSPTLTAANVLVSYACSDTGVAGRVPPLLSVTVKVQGVTHAFTVPGLLGIAATVTMPPFATTRISEDLYSTP